MNVLAHIANEMGLKIMDAVSELYGQRCGMLG
jgi:hypothetical protein